MTKSRGILPPRQPWTEEQLQLLRDRYPDERAEDLVETIGHPKVSIYGKANALGLKKSQAFLDSDMAARIVRGRTDPRLVGTRFQKGHVPANKDLRRPGYAPGRMAETQFKPGGRTGKAARLYRPIGAERISKDGYLERKVNDDMPLQRRWRAVHLLVWEAERGPLPPGHAIAFKDGNKRNIELGNLELVTRAELMRRNTVHNLPKPLADLVRLRGRVVRQINKREGK